MQRDENRRLQAGEIKIKNKSEKAKRRDPWSDIKNHLVAQPQEILIDLLLEVAHRDDRLYRSLLLKAERTGDFDNVVKTYQMVIDEATYIYDFIDWRAASTFADNIEQIVESLSELLTTDTAASLRAREIGAEIIMKATKVDGIYDSDPAKNPDAKKFESLTYLDVIQKKLDVMDATAVTMCMEAGLPILVFKMGEPGCVQRAVAGVKMGTFVR